MAFAILAGTLVSVLVALFVAAYHRAPTRQQCPNCMRRTEAVQLPAWLALGRDHLSRRWCTACSWEGFGRAGPELEPGNPIAHDSGFRFGEDVLGPDMGFEWGDRADASPTPRRHHPSGFRFADGDQAAPPPPIDHPSGFRFGRGAELRGRPDRPSGFRFSGGDAPPPPPQADHPSGFRWATGPVTGPVFEWKPPRQHPPSTESS